MYTIITLCFDSRFFVKSNGLFESKIGTQEPPTFQILKLRSQHSVKPLFRPSKEGKKSRNFHKFVLYISRQLHCQLYSSCRQPYSSSSLACQCYEFKASKIGGREGGWNSVYYLPARRLGIQDRVRVRRLLYDYGDGLVCRRPVSFP